MDPETLHPTMVPWSGPESYAPPHRARVMVALVRGVGDQFSPTGITEAVVSYYGPPTLASGQRLRAVTNAPAGLYRASDSEHLYWVAENDFRAVEAQKRFQQQTLRYAALEAQRVWSDSMNSPTAARDFAKALNALAAFNEEN